MKMAGLSKLETFEEFLAGGTVQMDMSYLIFALILAAVLSFILGKLYVRYGTALSNRRKFATNFILLTTTTTLIIMVVKSSLALSLGLVGALSIVRFRSAIKEPEELAFLFLCISVGLGLGAGQVAVTVTSFIIISLLIFGRHFVYKKEESQNLVLVVSGKQLSLKKITEVLKKNASSVHLKRFDQINKENLEASFLIDFNSFEQLEKTKEELNALSKSITISYLDKSGL